MKTKLLLSLIVVLFISTTSYGQGFTKPAEGKSVIYIMKLQAGFTTTFLFNGQEFIGKLKSKSYVRYECEPGDYTFMSLAGATKSFLTAELAADKIYIVELRLMSQAIGGELPLFVNVNIDKPKFTKKFLPLANSQAPFEKDEALKIKMEKKWKKFTQKAYAKFETKLKAKNKHTVITKDMFYQE